MRSVLALLAHRQEERLIHRRAIHRQGECRIAGNAFGPRDFHFANGPQASKCAASDKLVAGTLAAAAIFAPGSRGAPCRRSFALYRLAPGIKREWGATRVWIAPRLLIARIY